MSHTKVAELLPWYVNGTLDLGDRQSAALEVASCDSCATDVDELTRIQAAIMELEAMAPEPSERGLARALEAVEVEEEKKRLGHPWLGWWWALTPFPRAFVVSAALGALVAFGIVVAPKPVMQPAAYDTGAATPITLESTPRQVGAARSESVNGVAQIAMNAKTNAAATQTMLGAPQIARTGSVNLIVPDVEKSISRIGAVARSLGGEVLSLDDHTPDQLGDRHTAQVEIGVPIGRFDDAIDAIGGIGALRSRSVSAENVASQIVDAQARLRDLHSTESDLLRIMARAGKIDDVLSVENQVTETRGEIEELDGQVQALQHRVAMATVDVALQDETAAAPAEIGIGAQLRDTWAAAVKSMQNFTVAVVSAALWAVAYAPYVLGISLVGGLVAAQRRRL